MQVHLERAVGAMESKDQKLAGLIAARGFADNHDYIVKTIENTLLGRTD